MVLWAPLQTEPVWKASEVSECWLFSCWGLNVPAQSQDIPQIKSSGQGEGASNGKHSPEHHDGLGKGPCECSLFWRRDNLSISTGQSCQTVPHWNSRHPFWFFMCPVEGTSIQWQLLPWAFDEELRRNIRHIWKRNYLLTSAKWLHYLLSLEGWGEASPRWFGKADISILAVIKCKIRGSCLKYLKIQTGQV